MKNADPERIEWAIGARARSQRLLLGLYEFGIDERFGPHDSRNAKVFSSLVACAFCLWRAAFLTDAPTRQWSESLDDARGLLKEVLTTNAVAFSTEHRLQGWTAGFYLTNVILRLKGLPHVNVKRVAAISLMGTNPHETWTELCDETEKVAEKIGCRLPL